MTRHQLQVIRQLKRLVVAHGTHRAAARSLGISQAYFSDIAAGYRKPGPKVIAALARLVEAPHV